MTRDEWIANALADMPPIPSHKLAELSLIFRHEPLESPKQT